MTPQELKTPSATWPHIMAGIASLPSITPYHLKLEYDGQTIEDDFFMAWCATPTPWAGSRICPPTAWT